MLCCFTCQLDHAQTGASLDDTTVWYDGPAFRRNFGEERAMFEPGIIQEINWHDAVGLRVSEEEAKQHFERAPDLHRPPPLKITQSRQNIKVDLTTVSENGFGELPLTSFRPLRSQVPKRLLPRALLRPLDVVPELFRISRRNLSMYRDVYNYIMKRSVSRCQWAKKKAAAEIWWSATREEQIASCRV